MDVRRLARRFFPEKWRPCVKNLLVRSGLVSGFPDRRGVVLSMVDGGGLGLELGPSHAPLFPKSQGYRVHILDHCSKAELVEKYQHQGVDLSRIEDVDFIWRGEPYRGK